MMAVAALLIAGAVQEGQTTELFVQYASTRPQLPVRFEYPSGWQVEESAGSHEVYSQVQVYGPAVLEPRLRTYLVIRCVPPKTEGGRYASLGEMVDAYRTTLQTGLGVDGEQEIQMLGRLAKQLEVSGTLWLPWESPAAQPVAVKGQRVFFEQDGRLYEAGWMATPEVSNQVAAAFSHLLHTFSFAQ